MSASAASRVFSSPALARPLTQIRFYFDYKSPYSFLAVDGIRRLEREYFVKVQWLPYAFYVDEIFGDPNRRTALQQAKVKYLYRDARRFANERGMKIYGPLKKFDSDVALMGALFAQSVSSSPALFHDYTDYVFRRFFERELDIEDVDVMASLFEPPATSKIDEKGPDKSSSGSPLPSTSSVDRTACSAELFKEFICEDGDGRTQLAEIRESAELDGCFGVPSTVVDGELFFGNDRMTWVRRKLSELDLERPAEDANTE